MMTNENVSPIIFAHRGASAFAPENTIPAFELAKELGADGIEFDVKLTRDGHVVVIHDQTVNRTTNGTGDLRKFTLDMLEQLNAGAKFSETFPSVKIPTLEQVFGVIGNNFLMNIELTNYSTPTDKLVDQVVKLIKKFNLGSKILFSSFFPRNLHLAKILAPEIPRALLTWPGNLGWLGRNIGIRSKSYSAIHPHLTDVDRMFITRMHEQGKRVNTWTVNDPGDIQRLFDSGVDGIITDDPEMALRITGRKK